MRGSFRTAAFLSAAVLAAGCAKKSEGPVFEDDVRFLKKHTRVIELSDAEGRARIAVCPDWQARVMTSTADGPGGASFGWIHRAFIASGRRDPRMNAFGGEDRFWLGPEGGQYSLYFAPGEPFDFAHWNVPPPIDIEPYETVETRPDLVRARKDMSLGNASGFRFDLRLDRTLRLLRADSALADLGSPPEPGVRGVAFESENTITNTGASAWRRETGLVSVWILGMYNPSPDAVAVLPYRTDPGAPDDPEVNDAYFGKVPADRLVARNGRLFFRCDGLLRSKIGLKPGRCRPVLGSWDASTGALTLVRFTLPDRPLPYVNSMWERQQDPCGGDAVNSYNDGPPAPGEKPMGPFYELETSSPAAELAPGASLTHVHRTLHLTGAPEALDRVARLALGAGLEEIRSAFGP
jgi:hypothetical protein